MRQTMIFWLSMICTLGVDRITKFFVVQKMELGQTIPVINGFFHFTLVKNAGAAFGLLAQRKWLFIIITLAVLGVIIFMVYASKNKNLLFLTTLGMISGGALGNLLDRLQTGLVIDFLDFRGIWPYIFNLADSAIVIGVFLLAWYVLRTDQI